MEPLSLIAGLLAIPVAMLGIALLGGEQESVREFLLYVWRKLRGSK